jgi:hypothetical protein
MSTFGHGHGTRNAAFTSMTLKRGRTLFPVHLLAVLVLLSGSLIPLWHVASRISYAAEPAALSYVFDGSIAGLSGAICHQDNDGGQDRASGGSSPLAKTPCPLCLALQGHAAAVAPPALYWPSFSFAAAKSLIPAFAEALASGGHPQSGQPRAPPLA